VKDQLVPLQILKVPKKLSQTDQLRLGIKEDQKSMTSIPSERLNFLKNRKQLRKMTPKFFGNLKKKKYPDKSKMSSSTSFQKKKKEMKDKSVNLDSQRSKSKKLQLAKKNIEKLSGNKFSPQSLPKMLLPPSKNEIKMFNPEETNLEEHLNQKKARNGIGSLKIPLNCLKIFTPSGILKKSNYSNISKYCSFVDEDSKVVKSASILGNKGEMGETETKDVSGKGKRVSFNPMKKVVFFRKRMKNKRRVSVKEYRQWKRWKKRKKKRVCSVSLERMCEDGWSPDLREENGRSQF
jgi:hypothetical protein